MPPKLSSFSVYDFKKNPLGLTPFVPLLTYGTWLEHGAVESVLGKLREALTDEERALEIGLATELDLSTAWIDWSMGTVSLWRKQPAALFCIMNCCGRCRPVAKPLGSFAERQRRETDGDLW
jgi:hypothetical protein